MNKSISIHENITIDVDYYIESGGSSHPLSEDPPYINIEIENMEIFIEILDLKLKFSIEQQKKYFEKFSDEIYEELEK